MQKIELSKIICDEWKTNNKNNTYNNEFYTCNKVTKIFALYVRQFMIKITLLLIMMIKIIDVKSIMRLLLNIVKPAMKTYVLFVKMSILLMIVLI